MKIPDDLQEQHKLACEGENDPISTNVESHLYGVIRSHIERIAALEQQLEQERKTYQTNVATMQQNEKVLIESHTRELAQAKAGEALDGGILWEEYQRTADKKFTFSGWLLSLLRERDTLRTILIEIGRDAGCVLADNVSTEFLANLPNELRLQRDTLRAQLERMGRPVTDGFWAIVGFYTQDIIGVCTDQSDVLAEEPKATFIPISEADYDSFEEWDRTKKDAILAARERLERLTAPTDNDPLRYSFMWDSDQKSSGMFAFPSGEWVSWQDYCALRERMGRRVTDPEWLELCAGTPVTSEVAECYMSRRALDEWIAARARQQEQNKIKGNYILDSRRGIK